MYRKIVLCLGLLPAMVLGLPADRQQPVDINSDYAEMDQDKGVSLYRGNVVINQGTTHLRADKVKIYLGKNNEVKKMVATGQRAHYWTQVEVDKPDMHARAKKITYHVSERKIELEGNGEAIQGTDSLSGEQLTYDLDKQLLVSQKHNGGRTHMVIHPENHQQDKKA